MPEHSSGAPRPILLASFEFSYLQRREQTYQNISPKRPPASANLPVASAPPPTTVRASSGPPREAQKRGCDTLSADARQLPGRRDAIPFLPLQQRLGVNNDVLQSPR